MKIPLKNISFLEKIQTVSREFDFFKYFSRAFLQLAPTGHQFCNCED